VLPETHSIATRATPQSSLAGEVGSCSTGTEEAICRLAQGLLKSLDRSDITGVERAGLRTVQDVLNNPSQVCALTSPEAQWHLPGRVGGGWCRVVLGVRRPDDHHTVVVVVGLRPLVQPDTTSCRGVTARTGTRSVTSEDRKSVV